MECRIIRIMEHFILYGKRSSTRTEHYINLVITGYTSWTIYLAADLSHKAEYVTLKPGNYTSLPWCIGQKSESAKPGKFNYVSFLHKQYNSTLLRN